MNTRTKDILMLTGLYLAGVASGVLVANSAQAETKIASKTFYEEVSIHKPGVYIVGAKDGIPPGKYYAVTGGSCLWKRLAALENPETGEEEKVLYMGFLTVETNAAWRWGKSLKVPFGSKLVVKETDYALEISGCWIRPWPKGVKDTDLNER